MTWELILEVLRGTFLITGLVITMMMMIEYINVKSAGKWFGQIKDSKPKQVLLAACLGIIPGCIGGFATISLYSHRMLSFGALIAMMICSSGDEAFVLLAMIPKDALILFAVLFVIGLSCGLIIDKLGVGKSIKVKCDQEFELHTDHDESLPSIFKLSSYRNIKFTWDRVIILVGVALFITSIFTGLLECNHADHALGHETCTNPAHGHSHTHGGFDLLNERWINILFACLSTIVLFFTLTAKEHFIKEHIWHHVIKKHCLSIFLWTLSAIAIIKIGMLYVDIEPWLSANVFLVIIIAALIGMIPESGPHMIFVTLFAGGFVPFSVLLASSISQDGHTTLPLLAASKMTFIKAKILNVLIAILIGGGAELITKIVT